ncbi:hypothetical protein [Peristeroidobacter agariperforans]|uniref:hypothetical protein n=1 Tax=Peristeroidobacter agariperforans TaxID=268404 RepID=UPI001E5C6D41|nr:hypothetical protein [Peristeroidobacter agariperforans]
MREYDLDGRVSAIDSAGLSSYESFPDGTISSWANEDDAWPAEAGGLTEFDIDTASNRLAGSDGLQVRTYSYDAAGNITSDGTRTFAYNDAGRMIQATYNGLTASYLLNGLGQRVRKSVTGQHTHFVYDEAGRLIGEYDNSGGLIQETVWLDDVPVAVLKSNGSGVSVFYVHADHLTTARKISRPSDNAIVWRWDSDPFGSTLAMKIPMAIASPLNTPCAFQGSTLMMKRRCTTTTSGTMTRARGDTSRAIPLDWAAASTRTATSKPIR